MRFLFFFFCFSTLSSFGQLFSNPITGTDPNLDNPYTTGQTVDPNITASGIGRGSGATGSGASNRYSASSWNTAAIDLTAYFEFTLTPNAGCSINFTDFIYTAQASASAGMSFAFRSSVDSYVADIGTPTATGATISLTGASYQGITSAITFRLYAWGAGSGSNTFSVNSFEFNGTTTCSSNTVTTGAITGAPFTVTCPSTTASGTVAFTSAGTFIAGNVYTAQLSNAAGSFASPTNIGTVTSTTNSGTINITIPGGAATGTGYKIRIMASTPSVTGTNSATFTITQAGSCATVTPYLTSMIYDGCNTTTCPNEGQTEITFGTTADFSLTVSSANIDINYPGSPTYDLVGSVVDNTATTADINTAAGCAGTFIDGFGQTMPPNSTFIIVPSGICVSGLSWNAMCGQGPIYLIYAQSGTAPGDSWYTNGNFGNTTGIKSFTVDFTTTDGSTVNTSYNYTPPNSTNGNYATFGPGGGASATQGNFPNCALTIQALSTTLLKYTGEKVNSTSLLKWETINELHNSHFIVEHSLDGIEWNKLGEVKGAGTNSNKLNYEFTHDRPSINNNYYQLKSVDFDGKTYSKGIVVLNFSGKSVFYDSGAQMIHLEENASIEIYSLDGKLVLASDSQTSIPFNHKGMFIVYDKNSNESFKIVTY